MQFESHNICVVLGRIQRKWKDDRLDVEDDCSEACVIIAQCSDVRFAVTSQRTRLDDVIVQLHYLQFSCCVPEQTHE